MNKRKSEGLKDLLEEEINSLPDNISYSIYQLGYTSPLVWGAVNNKDVLDTEPLDKKQVKKIIINKLGFEGDNIELINLCYESWVKYKEFLLAIRNKKEAKEERESEKAEEKAKLKSRKRG